MVTALTETSGNCNNYNNKYVENTALYFILSKAEKQPREFLRLDTSIPAVPHALIANILFGDEKIVLY